MNSYDIGSVVDLSVTFTDLTGNPVNPSGVELLLQTPDGVTEIIPIGALLNPSAGVFTYANTTTQHGITYYRYQASGSLVAVADGSFMVNPSPFLPC